MEIIDSSHDHASGKDLYGFPPILASPKHLVSKHKYTTKNCIQTEDSVPPYKKALPLLTKLIIFANHYHSL